MSKDIEINMSDINSKFIKQVYPDIWRDAKLEVLEELRKFIITKNENNVLYEEGRAVLQKITEIKNTYK